MYIRTYQTDLRNEWDERNGITEDHLMENFVK